MSTDEIRTQTREVSGFDQVTLAGFGDLRITQGETESLTIEAPQEVLHRIITEVSEGRLTIRFKRSWTDWMNVVISAGLSGMRVRFDVTVRDLTGLLIMGAGRIRVGELKTDRLSVELQGAGDVSLEGLDAEKLEVTLPGAGMVTVTGRVTEQRAAVRGAGSYEARDLESQRAKVTVEGIGSATVWAVSELDAAIRGVGTISYYGSPDVRREVAGPGSIRSLGSRE